MLNGGSGDFCLQTALPDENDISPEDYYSSSWSSNTKNFIVLDNDNLIVYNWKKNKSEPIPIKDVENQFDKFYKYIVSNSYKSESDVVPFIVSIFKEFRNSTQEKNNPTEALNLLFVLLAKLEGGSSNINFTDWGLDPIIIPNDFSKYSDRLAEGLSNIKPKINLIMRHSAGVLFQEAQREVMLFDRQIDLWGNFSNKYKSKTLLYSSVHYTPPYLSRTIVENAIRKIDLSKNVLKIFDPSCGSGEFLMEALKQLEERTEFTGKVQIIGWDTSATAIQTTKFLLTYEKTHTWNERMSFSVETVNDSLQKQWDNDCDLILMNPPFISWEQMNKDSRSAVNEVLSSFSAKKPNQASAFFCKSIQALNKDGVIGCVMPSSFLSLDAYLKIREYTFETISIDLIAKLGNFIFEDALTDVSLFVGHKPKDKSIPLTLWTRNEKGVAHDALRHLRKMHFVNLGSVNERDYSAYKPSSFPINAENWKPISFQENELFKKLKFSHEGKLVRVKDVFNVQQGIRTGNNRAFKISAKEYEEYPENEKIFFRPAIDNESVKNGKITANSYVWYPYDAEGLIIKNEQELINKAPQFYQKRLSIFKEDLIKRARKDSSNWWQLSEHRAWLRKIESRLVSTEFGKSNSFAFDKEGNFAVERGNAWIPQKKFTDIDYYYFYLAIFSSLFFDKLLSIYSKELLFGWDLGKKYTKDIPIPNIHSNDVKSSIAYTQLVEIGKELSVGNFYSHNVLDKILLKYFYPSTI